MYSGNGIKLTENDKEAVVCLYVSKHTTAITSDKTISSLQLDYIEDSYCDFCSY